jgi:DNA-directed RNA polymerase specialized sigma24 family protein
MSDLSPSEEQPAETAPSTLGDVLYAKSKPVVPEHDWAKLVQAIAAGDQLALHALYERAHRAVFTLMMRLTANRETAEELTIDVFHDVWRHASRYDAAAGTVLGWINAANSLRGCETLRTRSGSRNWQMLGRRLPGNGQRKRKATRKVRAEMR